LGWQAHTTRAALSRLRTAGFEIKREQSSNGGPARYRLVSAPGREWRSDGR
jgi:DNA-binding transcriptional regulator PaaX